MSWKTGLFAIVSLAAIGCGSGGSNDAPPPSDSAVVVDAIDAADVAVLDAIDATDVATDASKKGLDLGVAYSPRHHLSSTVKDITDFYEGHAAYGRLVSFHMNWRDTPASAGTIPNTATQTPGNAKTYAFTPVVGFGWEGSGKVDLTSDSEPTNATWTNKETRAKFLSMVSAYAKSARPPYLFLGNETNTWALAHPTEWPDWVSEYRACYDAIKAVSPTTIVFTTFQLEHLKGLGRKAGWKDAPQWSLLDGLAGKLDALGFTTYPYLEYESPAEIPADYYTEIGKHFAGKIIFSEIGWLADPAIPWTGSETEQADFVTAFFDRTTTVDLQYVVYLFEHDVDVLKSGRPFAGIGLKTNDGTPRAADAIWRAVITARD